MTNTKSMNEMASKKLRHKTEIQHTKGLTNNGSKIDLKTENKTRVFQFWQLHLIDLLQPMYNVSEHQSLISNSKHVTKVAYKISGQKDHGVVPDKFRTQSILCQL